MGNRSLLLFQIGPVQEFIAQAAEISDLWAGSYLLSDLIYAGIQKIPEYRESVVFPNFKTDQVETALRNLIPTIPNRFLAFIPNDHGAAREIVQAVDSAIRGRLIAYAEKLSIPGAATQARQFLSTTWAVLSEPTGRMGEDYQTIGKKLALRRNLRDFRPWREDPGFEHRLKDFLSGKEAALKDGLGALNLIKRALVADFEERLPTFKLPAESGEADPYLAVIAMDGDRMGKRLSSFQSEGEHRSFSRKLAEFSSSVKGIISTYSGYLIYAGGDDVLAVVPAKKAFSCAKKLSDQFKGAMNDSSSTGEEEITASAGIAIGHSKAPLQELVILAHAAETHAKEDYGRNAMAVGLYKRSGEILQWGCNWNSVALPFYEQISDIHGEQISNRFPYKLAGLIRPYGVLDSEMGKVVTFELHHALERSSDEYVAGRGKFEANANAYLKECVEKDRMNDFLNLFLCETFINRPREEN